jgi:elongation factor G
MDRTGANFENVFAEIREKLGANAVKILIPIGAEEHLKGQIDVVNQKAVYYSDDDKFGSTYTISELDGDHKLSAKEAYEELVNAVADVDDEVAEKFLMEEPVTREELKRGIRRATIANKSCSRCRWFRLQKQGCAIPSRCGCGLSAQPARHPACLSA